MKELRGRHGWSLRPGLDSTHASPETQNSESAPAHVIGWSWPLSVADSSHPSPWEPVCGFVMQTERHVVSKRHRQTGSKSSRGGGGGDLLGRRRRVMPVVCREEVVVDKVPLAPRTQTCSQCSMPPSLRYRCCIHSQSQARFTLAWKAKTSP